MVPNSATFLVLLLSTVYAVDLPAIEQDGNTALAVKHGIEDFSYPIPGHPMVFKELVQQSKLFVDNTLFIKEILSEPDSTLLVCPHSLGKSTLLTMLKTFLEIEVDEDGNANTWIRERNNYKLFKLGEIIHNNGTVETLRSPLLIAKHEKYFDFYHGKHPVIYITFKNTMGENSYDVRRRMAYAISQAYKDHKYMIKVLHKKLSGSLGPTEHNMTLQDLKNFQKFVNFNVTSRVFIDELITSVQKLRLLLWRHHHRQCYVLIDDYDSPVHSYMKFPKFRDTDAFNILNVLQSFLSISTTESKEYSCARSIVTGKFSLMLPKWRHYNTYDIAITDHPLREYFGFKERHVQFLYRYLNITEKEVVQTGQWYGGYQLKDKPHDIYNSKSIIKFLNNPKITCYRMDKRFVKIMSGIFIMEPRYRNRVFDLISTGQFQTHESEEQRDFIGLNLLFLYHAKFTNPSDALSRGKLLLFFPILKTEMRTEKTPAGKIRSIVNKESQHIIHDWLIWHYRQKFLISDSILDDTADHFLKFIRNETVFDNFKKHFNHLYRKSYIQENSLEELEMNPGGSEDPALSILNCISLRMQCLSLFEIDAYYKNVKSADIVVYDHKTQLGVVIEIRQFFGSAHKAFQSATDRLHVLESIPNVKNRMAIGINIALNRSTDILYKIL